MAKSSIPNPLERRHLVERPMEPDAALRLAEIYVGEGRSWEAIAFFAKAGARDRLLALLEQATGEGDAFMVRELERALGEEVTSDRWRAVAEAAVAAGKDRFAAQARRLAERGESARQAGSQRASIDRKES
jgi:hypothetical protein